ncbi:hypothetical protein [Streptomyces sp. NBC_00996]|uniref:hypothetical protein n=1 Tax=Streptomyces sp. NBC_00996 TaxID=2903710 RepID=UPI00386B6E3D|nr:hypothetical protein OG390_17410 [Streptomyces sp. NBC_00996]
MKIRTDIAAMLRAGTHTQRAIAEALNVSPKTVRLTREALKLPAPSRGRPQNQAADDVYRAGTEPVEGGHLRWTGAHTSSGVPLIRSHSKQETVYRIAFRLHYGRDPEGNATPGCGMPGCVAGAHLADRLLRQANQRAANAYEAIFGSPPTDHHESEEAQCPS